MLKLVDVSKSFGRLQAVKSANLEIPSGEFFSILGPSGCGKTTLLRLLGGFEHPTSGEIFLDGRRIDGLPPHIRKCNTVFQRYALFPHLSVAENVAFGLKMKKVPTAEIAGRVQLALGLVQMEHFSDRSVTTLSGGQQQRIALARALVNEPKVLLLDEPLSALDEKLRQQMKVELLTLQRKLRQTFIFVTHDQEEALTVSDRVAVMNHGVVEQVGTPQEIYEYPKTLFVAQFIGAMNSLKGDVREASNGGVIVNGATRKAMVVKGSRDGLRPLPNVSTGTKVQVMIRPEKMKVLKSSPSPDQNYIEGVVTEVLYKGANTQFLIDPKHTDLPLLTVTQVNSAVSSKRNFQAQEKVFVAWQPEDCILMGEQGAIVETAAPAPTPAEIPVQASPSAVGAI